MKHYVDGTGAYLGQFDAAAAPAEAAEVPGGPAHPGQVWQAGAWVCPPAVLAERKLAAQAEVDRQAEAARLRFLTPGAGQAMEYQRTAEEAEAAIAGGAADFVGYPMLAAERDAAVAAGAPSPGVQDVAATVIAERDAWVAAGALIKTTRRAAKLQIAAAADAAAIDAVLAGLTWLQPQ